MDINEYAGEFSHQEFRVNQVGRDASPDHFNKKRDNHMSAFFRTDSSSRAGKMSIVDEESGSSRSNGMSQQAKEELMLKMARRVSIHSTLHKQQLQKYLSQAQ